MPKIVFGFDFDTETKTFKFVGNTDIISAMRILLDVVNELIKPKEISEVKPEIKEVKSG